jgi:membrane-associated protease RseP (regulator of RpoE activity)
MKSVSLLIACLVFLGVSLQAQTTTSVEKNTKRITITTTKVDEHGQPVTETWIAEGDQPEVILQNMAVNPDVLQKVDAEKISVTGEGERLFLIKSAGDHTVIEGRLHDLTADQINATDGTSKVIVLSNGDNDGTHEYKVVKWYGHDRSYGDENKSNCAALGIYVNSPSDKTGCLINSLIEQGGAQEAGMTNGDVITRLDDYAITDFPSLFDALKHYLPGEEVTVTYTRDGKSIKANVHLKSWADMPGQEWRARGDCGKVEDFKEEAVKSIPEDTPGGPVSVEPLKLTDARVYPNPTDGVFALSFTTEPGPITISITDVNGKVVYSERNDNATGYYNHDIDLKNVATGNYVVAVKQGDKVFTQQLSKQ